jgi:hypothetical protein
MAARPLRVFAPFAAPKCSKSVSSIFYLPGERGWINIQPLFNFKLLTSNNKHSPCFSTRFDILEQAVYIGIIRGKIMPPGKGVLTL